MNKRIFLLFFVFLLILVFPSLVFVLFAQSSYALGIVLSSLLIITVSLLFVANKFIHKFVVREVSFFFLLLIIHSYLSIIFNSSFDFNRFVFSCIFLFILIFGAIGFGNMLLSFSEEEVDRTLIMIFILFVLSGILWGSNFLPAFGAYKSFISPIFPFAEPSHFALFFSPFFCYIIGREKSTHLKYLLYLVPLLFLFFFNNLTLLVVFIFILLITATRLYPVLIVGSLALVYVFISVDLSYYTQRISLDENNLSSLIWIQGWDEAIINFKLSNYIGVGFQQFGVIPPRGEFSKIVNLIYTDDFNRYDGGTMAAKIFGEFGVLGLFFLVYCLRLIIKSGLVIYKNNKEHSLRMTILFAHCCIFCFSFELFIRTTSYFSPSFFLFISSLFFLKNEYKFSETNG